MIIILILSIILMKIFIQLEIPLLLPDDFDEKDFKDVKKI